MVRMLGGDVDGEASHGHRFVMTLKFRVVFGDALECGADALHLGVVVLKGGFQRWSLCSFR
jgi:hypothetical protein